MNVNIILIGFFSVTTSEANLIIHFSDERERNEHWWLAVIAVLPFLLPWNNATHTINSERINGYIREVVDEFNRNPKDGNSPLNGERRCEELYSFPSSDHIMSIFMIDFDTKKKVYQNEMKKVIGSAISCDHTFRVSNNIGMVRPGNDNKFVTQFNNLFIMLNEKGKLLIGG